MKHVSKPGSYVLHNVRHKLKIFLAGDRELVPGVANCDPELGFDPMLPDLEGGRLLNAVTLGPPLLGLRAFLFVPPRFHLLLLVEDHREYAVVRFATDLVACLAWLDDWLSSLMS